jgi:hypothetical protein
MSKMKTLVVLLATLSVLVSACASPTPAPTLPAPSPTAAAQPATKPAPTSSPNPTAVPTVPAPTPIPVRGGRPGFAAYAPVPVQEKPQVPAYSFDLARVARPEELDGLTPAQRAALEKNGFVVVPQRYPQIYQVYKNAQKSGQTIFVTSDAILHTYHIVYDYSLRTIEIGYFYDNLKALTAAMLKASQQQMQNATAPSVQEAARLNVAYFAVASVLLDPAFAPPPEAAEPVQQELALIETHSGFAESPILGKKEDYSQYVPRGHYTRNETFGRYFKAMLWYGRLGFLSNDEDVAVARRHTRQALLITNALATAQAGNQSALQVWDSIYEPTVFYVGSADDLTVYDYQQVAAKVYKGIPAPNALADDSTLDAFRTAIGQLPPPRIVGGLVTDQQDAAKATRGFRFMGQRFIPDSYIFQQLVYNKVTRHTGSGAPFTLSQTDAGPVRGFPRGLDLAAAMGSLRAFRILADEGDIAYLNYADQLTKVQQAVKRFPLDVWTQNLYWNWLYSLKPLLDASASAPGYPAFMRNNAWVDKSIHTYLGSWAELRHDTILYAKQSYTLGATSMQPEPKPATAYVEPQPQVYARLAALTAQMQKGLDSRGLLSMEMNAKLKVLYDLLIDLKGLSEKELRGEALDEAEVNRLRDIGGVLENLTTFSDKTQQAIASETDERMAIIADVHTDPNTQQVLEEGVGDAFLIVVLVPVGQDVFAARGGVFSYYEFKQPLDNRLTDEQWQKLDPKPDQPNWTNSFIP